MRCPPCVVLELGDHGAARLGVARVGGRERDVVRPSGRTRERHPRARPYAASYALQSSTRRRPRGRDVSRCRERQDPGACNAPHRAPLRRCEPSLRWNRRRPHGRSDGLDVVAVPGSPPGLVSAPDPRLSGCRRLRDLHRRDQRRRRVRGAPARSGRHRREGGRRALPARAHTREPAHVPRHEPRPRTMRDPRAPRRDRRPLPRRARGTAHRQPPRSRDRLVVSRLRRCRR